jgi:hypothetical protein
MLSCPSPRQPYKEHGAEPPAWLAKALTLPIPHAALLESGDPSNERVRAKAAEARRSMRAFLGEGDRHQKKAA